MNTNDSGIPFNIELGCPLFIQANSLNQRIPTFLIGVIPQAGLKGVMIDMSSNGFLFSARMFDEDTPPQLSLNCPVDIFMPLMGIEGKTKLKGIIRNIRRNDNGLQLGIALTNLSDNISVMLEKYVYTIMRHA